VSSPLGEPTISQHFFQINPFKIDLLKDLMKSNLDKLVMDPSI